MTFLYNESRNVAHCCGKTECPYIHIPNSIHQWSPVDHQFNFQQSHNELVVWFDASKERSFPCVIYCAVEPVDSLLARNEEGHFVVIRNHNVQ